MKINLKVHVMANKQTNVLNFSIGSIEISRNRSRISRIPIAFEDASQTLPERIIFITAVVCGNQANATREEFIVRKKVRCSGQIDQKSHVLHILQVHISWAHPM